ncbi:MAG: DNA primase catalytic subunit PriS [Candidatus Micrarchaeota archaeon]
MAEQFMQSREAQLVMRKFREYYSHSLRPPSSLHMREFGFGFEKKIDFRHRAFSSDNELKAFFERETPLFASYSAAYYRYPAATPMEKKEYLGADLIFDLDANAEHEGHNKLFCAYCLETVKQDTIRLVEDFLLDDFGFTKEEVKINFSGQKGYHIHLEEKKFRELSQEARKQMLNYINATDLDMESILVKQQLGYGRHILRGPTKESKGWAKKLYIKAIEFIRDAKVEDLRHFGLRKKDSEDVFGRKEFIIRKMAEGNWDLLKGLDTLWENLLKDTVSLKSVNVDRNVTFDLARLIRLPDSLHGDTGYIAKSLKLNELKEFDPTKDAIAFKGERMRIRNTSSIEFEFAGGHYNLKEHEEIDLPEALAVLLLCKRHAKLV